ncbi:uncharacterized protein BJ212DRAFT_1302741 [Suillus subaureus]|uniref:Uncharacterized protein n=1 Tax=Suillus subaureus TaxID=48587 RepID=A0A9P7E2D0_9AGAM|nr:uncharacterized protein BJ212DRAFT_1302741 [Suillus subaureus]KAG1809183.1 hypothetical protein BJ212DRAFT_1302741 [Suillus subaureus]
MVVCIIHVEDGLVKYRDSFPGGPVALLTDISKPTFVANNAIYTLQILLGDGGWRLQVWLQSHSETHTRDWIATFLAFNASSTGLLACRIWMIEPKARNQPGLYNGNCELYTTVYQDRLGEGTMDVYVEMYRFRNDYLVRFGFCVQRVEMATAVFTWIPPSETFLFAASYVIASSVVRHNFTFISNSLMLEHSFRCALPRADLSKVGGDKMDDD